MHHSRRLWYRCLRPISRNFQVTHTLFLPFLSSTVLLKWPRRKLWRIYLQKILIGNFETRIRLLIGIPQYCQWVPKRAHTFAGKAIKQCVWPIIMTLTSRSLLCTCLFWCFNSDNHCFRFPSTGSSIGFYQCESILQIVMDLRSCYEGGMCLSLRNCYRGSIEIGTCSQRAYILNNFPTTYQTTSLFFIPLLTHRMLLLPWTRPGVLLMR